MTLRIDNHTTAVRYYGACEVGTIAVYEPLLPLSAPRSTSVGTCPAIVVGVEAGQSYTWDATTPAPAESGHYWVIAEPSEGFPDSFREPLSLRVAAESSTGSTTSTTIRSGLGTIPQGPAPTSALMPTTSSRTPQPGDFSGALTADRTTTSVESDVNIDLNIRNITDHEIEPSLGSLPNSVAIVCAPDLTSDGATTHALISNENLFFVTSPPLKPGESSGRTGSFRVTEADIGAITCAAAIVTSNSGWIDGSIRTVGRITNIPTVSFSVTPLAATTTAAPSIGSTTSTTTIGP